MTFRERTRGLVRAPKLVWDVLARGRYAFQYDQMPMLADRMSAAKRLNLFRAGANLLSPPPAPLEHASAHAVRAGQLLQPPLSGLPHRYQVLEAPTSCDGCGTVRARHGPGWPVSVDRIPVGLG